MLEKRLAAAIYAINDWMEPDQVEEVLRLIGNIPDDDFRRTFNLGAGMIFAVPARGSARAEGILTRMGETPFRIGSVVAQKRGRARVEYR